MKDLNERLQNIDSFVTPSKREEHASSEEQKIASDINGLVDSMKKHGITSVNALSQDEKFKFEIGQNPNATHVYDMSMSKQIGQNFYMKTDNYADVTHNTAERIHNAVEKGSNGTEAMIKNWNDVSHEMVDNYQSKLCRKYGIDMHQFDDENQMQSDTQFGN